MSNSHRAKAVFISSIGGGLEIYDFTIYIFFAPIFATLFFPQTNSSLSLLNTFAIFAVGYFSRPLGAILFGHYGDRFGRKKGMLISIAIMATSTVLIGLLPTYATIGIAAPILLAALRFFQGIAVGGDLPGAITFVAEYADYNKRGLICSLVYCGVNLGILLASTVGAILTLFLSHEHLVAWGWRIAFFLGLWIGIAGIYLRSKVAETPYFNQLAETQDILKTPLAHLFRIHTRQVLQGIGLVWLFAVIIAQIFLYMPTYLHTTSHLKLTTALILNSINVLIFSLCIPLMGYLSDRLGRRPVVLITALAFIIFTYPLYTLLNNAHLGIEITALSCFAILSAGIVGTVPSALSELFATHVRYSGVAVAYNVGFAVFAGLTPIIATYLLYKLQFIQAPSFNLIFSAIIALIATLVMKEGSQKAF